jgi:hypothetical protein
MRTNRKRKAVLRAGWTNLANAVAEIGRECGLSKQEAARQVITAARDGALYTRGRLYHVKGHSIAICPTAWEGMDPDPVMSRLCPPNAGLEVQEPFLGAPVVHEVEIHIGSLEAWKAGETRPPAPIMQPITLSSVLRQSALLWRELHFPAESGKVESSPAPNNKVNGAVSVLREMHPSGIIPGWKATNVLLKRVNDTLKANGDLQISEDTLRRAIAVMKKHPASG